MEKILPHPVGPRFLDSPKDELRFPDRMVIRDDPPKWRGDHSFSAEAAAYSLTNFIEPEVTKKNPDWTREQVRKHALGTFEKRLRQDLTYEKKESAHEESSVTWKPIQKENGWELATAYGDTMITLSELWEHTKEFAAFSGNPAAYNAEEHRVQLRMQDAFIRGEATGFVSVLSHPDTTRYVQVWKKADDGTIVSTHVDLAKTTGRDFTHEEGATLIRNLQSVHGGDATPESSYAHFFVRGEGVSEHAIRTVAILRTIEVNHARIPRERESVGDPVLGAYLREHIERKISVLQERTQKKRKPLSEHSFPVMETSNGIKSKRTRADKEEPIKSVLADWFLTKRIVQYVDHVPVAAVAVLTWIMRDAAIPSVVPKESVISHKIQFVGNKEQKSDIKKPAIKNIIGLVAKHIELPIKKMKAFVFFEKKKPRTELRTSKRELNTARIYVRDSVQPLLRIVKRKTMQFIRGIFEIIKPPQDGTIKSERQDVPDTLKPMIVRSIAFAFRLLRIIRAHRARHQENTQDYKPSRREAAFFEIGSASWILLSIIWYLSLLREGGFAKKKQKKKSTRSLLWHHISLHFVIE